MPVTQFLSRANVTERISDFARHLRENGLRTGMLETEEALDTLRMIDAINHDEVRLALKSVFANNRESFRRFDELFDAYWLNTGKQRFEDKPFNKSKKKKNNFANLSQAAGSNEEDADGSLDLPQNDNDGDSNSSGEGRLIATEISNRSSTDMREFILPEDEAHAAEIAQRIAKAIRYRRSRRRRAAQRGEGLDMRRVIRKSISTGGEPVQLLWKKRRVRPIHLITILDVSGSMQPYARVFLSFTKGLVGNDQKTDAFLFHTNLMCVSDALRDNDTLRAVNRLSMMARGFGGGTKIGASLSQFIHQYAGRVVNSKTIIIIMSDGYDTGDARLVGEALAKLKRYGCKIIWLNPLLGWKNYSPVAASMSAALPHIDFFAPCNTLDSLANIEQELHHI